MMAAKQSALRTIGTAEETTMKTTMLAGVGTCVVLGIGIALMAPSAPRAQGGVPQYAYDGAWNKPLPNRWINGGLGGLCIDGNDHVLVLNRQDVNKPELMAGAMAPPMLEFDAAGNVVHSWGQPNLIDSRLHSCHYDKDGNVWIASAPSGMVQKYTHDGSKLLLQIGQKGVYDTSDGTEKGKPLNSPAAAFHMPSSIFVDRSNGDVYIADGENDASNSRIAVFDANGKFLRHWHPEGYKSVHCMTIANDGLVYVCNRRNGKIGVFDKMGKLQRSFDVPSAPVTTGVNDGGGAAVAVDFSHDSGQRLMFVVNQNNSRIDIMERGSGKMVGNFGTPGPYAGQFNQAHGIATDSKDNIYVNENRGRRTQKFKLVGG
jgi:DNA-binding beta-propeller fold protein YncE